MNFFFFKIDKPIQRSQSFFTKLVFVAFLSSTFFANAKAQASDSAYPFFSFNGYGTVGLAHSSEGNADFVLDDTQAEGAGYSQSWSPKVDSRIGAQVSAQFSPDLGGIFQVISEQKHDASYSPQVEWAYLRYRLNDDFTLRIGRGESPVFLISDHRKVGYSLPWLRAPTELYGLIPNITSDGVELTYEKQFQEFRNQFRISFGESSAELPGNVQLKFQDSWSISDSIEYGDVTVKAFFARSKQETKNAGTYAALIADARTYGAEGNAYADKYDWTGKHVDTFTVGASYDPGDWFVMSEWGLINYRSIYGKKAAWYVSGGYRWGEFTPYLIFSKQSAKSDTYDPGLDSGVHGAGVVSINDSVNETLAAIPVQKTISLGVRWDFAKSAAFKMQYDYTDIGAGSYGTLNNRQPEYGKGGHFSVFSVVIDFLF